MCSGNDLKPQQGKNDILYTTKTERPSQWKKLTAGQPSGR